MPTTLLVNEWTEYKPAIGRRIKIHKLGGGWFGIHLWSNHRIQFEFQCNISVAGSIKHGELTCDHVCAEFKKILQAKKS